ncbi:type II toxin-antitoxin system VapC family toxin [Streptomyces sp. HC44]|uniref:Ribonuclease VapC n=1 Tax=Streptomyces scabichelini TaxID=2711217 RepID=A0A6G4V3H8_9ACTN|nr:PIN domain-containing protein [Streptomyces scabichelini]NGO08427.1 type II toxin-antitoxin system VapC family toxin [Streptomyces scabichelini]
MTATYALADTSVFVARETGRSMASPLPRNVFISPVTLAELSLGVLASRDDATRARRLATLTVASRYTVLAPDRIVASVWSQMMTEIAEAGRPMPKSRVNDAWIAATARMHDLPVITQDAGFTTFPGVQVIRV